MEVRLKRVYDPESPGDGFRVLVDKLWPRGIRKEARSEEPRLNSSHNVISRMPSSA